MDEGAPLLAVEDGDRAFLVGFRGEKVDHQVETGAIPEPKYRGEAQYGWVESSAARPEESPLGVNFGLAIQGDGLGRRVLIHLDVASPIDAAARREQEPAYTVPLGDFNEHSGSGVIGLQRRPAVLFARRVADDGRQVDDGFHASHRSNHVLDVPGVANNQVKVRMVPDRPQRFVAVQQAVQNSHAVTLFEKPLDEKRTDVPGAAHY